MRSQGGGIGYGGKKLVSSITSIFKAYPLEFVLDPLSFSALRHGGTLPMRGYVSKGRFKTWKRGSREGRKGDSGDFVVQVKGLQGRKKKAVQRIKPRLLGKTTIWPDLALILLLNTEDQTDLGFFVRLFILEDSSRLQVLEGGIVVPRCPMIFV